MKLLYQTHSPFARKALIFAHEVGIADQIEVLHHETSPTNRNEEVYAQNPLGKVPVLILPNAPAIFDSGVICAYFDTLHDGQSLIPAAGEARWQALRIQAMAQDMADIGIAVRWENARRPKELRYAPLGDGLAQKLTESYDWLERELHFDAPVDIGHIALASTLSWLEFRDFPGIREGHPRLSAWLDEFNKRPSMIATTLSGDTQD
ncbi:hypothetical protein K4F52_006150 [Lecanicillium sp. MT-2017a]|nr:hypothetical protein K4F52_006150 [Lecanicillium sp. MT-2017a]